MTTRDIYRIIVGAVVGLPLAVGLLASPATAATGSSSTPTTTRTIPTRSPIPNPLPSRSTLPRSTVGSTASTVPVTDPSGTSTTSLASGSSGASSSTSSGIPSSPQCTASRLAQAQQIVEGQLSARVTQLNVLIGRVKSSTKLTPSDRATLLTDLTSTELPGIEGLQVNTRQATTCAELRQDAHDMVFDYRVYLVMTPQTDLVIVTDDVDHADATLANLEALIARALQGPRASGVDQAAWANYQSEVTAADGLTSGQSSTLLGLSPSEYPTTKPVLSEARSNVTQAVRDLRVARDDLSLIIHSLSSS
jgi:hypothetical protein